MHTTNNLISVYLFIFRANYSVNIFRGYFAAISQLFRSYKVLYNSRIKVGRYIAYGPMSVNNNNVLY